MTTEWTEVSQELFYRIIGPQDVRPHILPSKWPYTIVFRTPYHQERGKIIDTDAGGRTLSTYWLPRPATEETNQCTNTEPE